MKKKPPYRILFILPSLRAGGAERVVSFIAQNLDRDKFIPIMLIVGFEKDAAFQIDNVETHFLNKQRVLEGVRGIFSKIRSIRPDLVMTSIAHLTAVTTIQAYYFRNIRFVAREANIKKITKIYHDNNLPMGKTLNKVSYKLLDAIICQSKDMAEELIELHPKTAKKIRIINNPITKSLSKSIQKHPEKPQFITVGRLHNEKGHGRILEALSLLDFDFTYLIIGSGPHKALIEDKVKELKLDSKVDWIDYTQNVEDFLIQSSIFIQGSYAEGFPNALLESCAMGTPVIAYNAPGGTSEIVEPEINGYLVDSEEELHDKIIHLINHPIPKAQIIESVEKKFGKAQIIKQYETLFLDLIEK
ncbi:MAG: glycosyltransferase [Psychroserpens sp.]|nr:glycosyltransferase [Psychroserpens sp.]